MKSILAWFAISMLGVVGLTASQPNSAGQALQCAGIGGRNLPYPPSESQGGWRRCKTDDESAEAWRL